MAVEPAPLAPPQWLLVVESHGASLQEPVSPVAAWPSAVPSLLPPASSSPQPWTQIWPSAHGHHWKLQTQARRIRVLWGPGGNVAPEGKKGIS